MTIDDLQLNVDAWIKSNGVRYFNELTNMTLLTEEVGELARIMARKFGEQIEKPNEKISNIDDEIADVIFVLVCIAN